MKLCIIEGCDRQRDSRGLCNAHYKRLLRWARGGFEAWDEDGAPTSYAMVELAEDDEKKRRRRAVIRNAPDVAPVREHCMSPKGDNAEMSPNGNTAAISDELAVVGLITERLTRGLGDYGALDAGDDRDDVQEALEEALDCSVYLAKALLRLKRVR
jgi:hypothetical protein